jgi:uncharacterized membrane protein
LFTTDSPDKYANYIASQITEFADWPTCFYNQTSIIFLIANTYIIASSRVVHTEVQLAYMEGHRPTIEAVRLLMVCLVLTFSYINVCDPSTFAIVNT